MSVQNISGVVPVTPTTTSVETGSEVKQPRQAHSSTSTFERSQSTDLGGAVLALGSDEVNLVTDFLSSQDPATRERLQGMSYDFGAGLLRGPRMSDEQVKNACADELAAYLVGVGADQQRSASLAFIAGALGGVEASLFDFGAKVDKLNKLSEELRLTRTELRDLIDSWPEGQETQNFSWNEVSFDDAGNPVVTAHVNEPLTKEQAEKLLEDLDDMKQSVADTSELAKFDLQTQTEEYQRIVQLLTTIAEEDNRAKSNIINNIK